MMSTATASSETPSSGSNTNGHQSGTKQMISHVYLYDIPSAERSELCMILDRGIWEQLAMQMGYTKKDIDQIRYDTRNSSPTEELLSLWGEQNHTVLELFMLLSRLQQYPAMDSIRHLVPPAYHRLIFSGHPDLCVLMSNASLSGHKKTDLQNLKDLDKGKNIKSEKILNGPPESREDNESEFNSSIDGKSVKNSTDASYDMNNVNEYASAIPEIDYKELTEATNRWHKDNILGRGGFGTVFRGRWKFTDVAIKRIEYHGADPKKNAKVQIQQSLNELRYLNSCRHDNILPLYGYSINGNEQCLVYQLMLGGSLETRLTNTKAPLKVRQRLNIAVGTARGIQYLHTFNKKPLIHGDIKPANILLDFCSHPRIGDFGLAREGSIESMEVSRVYGTRPYLPAEFLENHTLSTKIDTYSFGVVLFELATGERAYDKSRGANHAFLKKYIWAKKDEINLVQLLDQQLDRTDDALVLFNNFIKIGLACTQERAEDRPEMVNVLTAIAQTALAQNIPDPNDV